jgi:hypothetical protein
MNETLKELYKTLDSLKKIADKCIKEHSQIDKEQEALLHDIESTNFNASSGYMFAKRLKEIRQKRRDVKNNYAIIQSAISNQTQCIVNVQNKEKCFSKIK